MERDLQVQGRQADGQMAFKLEQESSRHREVVASIEAAANLRFKELTEQQSAELEKV